MDIFCTWEKEDRNKETTRRNYMFDDHVPNELIYQIYRYVV